MELVRSEQEEIDRFYLQHGKCCAGCDHWQWHNLVAGECTRSAPSVGQERYSMIGLQGISLPVGAGHIITLRDHVCGEFTDSHEWENKP